MSSGPRVDLEQDLHTHSTLTDGADTPEAMADAAVRAGLRVWGLSDHVRADSDWVPDYVRRVRGLRRDGLQIRCGVEAKILDRAGRLDLPPALPELDYVLVADHQYPDATGPAHPREIAAELEAGRRRPADVVAGLVEATCAAILGAAFPAVIVHPFSLLPKLGLSEDEVTDEHLDALAAACARAGAAVEINEKWRCPSSRVVTGLAGRGVRLVPGSDAHRVDDVGVHAYARSLLETTLLETTLLETVPVEATSVATSP